MVSIPSLLMTRGTTYTNIGSSFVTARELAAPPGASGRRSNTTRAALPKPPGCPQFQPVLSQ